jgi:flagellar protein FlaI
MGMKPGNILVAGGAGSGKTSTLNCLASFIPPSHRIITIEDTAELQLPVEHWVRLETRPMNIEGKGEVDMDKLLKTTLRMRPDRIIVGEVRGKEAESLFTAMNTGHEGSLGTLHANSAKETITRLSNPPMNVTPFMISVLDIILIQERVQERGKVHRRVSEIAEVTGIKNEKVQLSYIYKWDTKANCIKETGTPSYILSKLASLKGITLTEVKEEVKKREEVLNWMVEHGIRDLKNVARVFDSYCTDPDIFNEENQERKS